MPAGELEDISLYLGVVSEGLRYPVAYLRNVCRHIVYEHSDSVDKLREKYPDYTCEYKQGKNHSYSHAHNSCDLADGEGLGRRFFAGVFTLELLTLFVLYGIEQSAQARLFDESRYRA